MPIRFNPSRESAVFEDGGLRVVLSALDSSEIRIWHRKSGIKIPSDAWTVDDSGEPTLDWSKLDEETAKKLDSDDDNLIASKVLEIDGETFEDPEGNEVDWNGIPKEFKPDIVRALKSDYPMFLVWCAQYIQGSKKKYGAVERVI